MAREEFVKQVAAIAVADRVWVDQCGCDEALRREYGWSVRGQRCFDERSGKRGQRWSVVAAWQESGEPHSGSGLLAPLCFEETCHHRLFELWLKLMLCPLLRPGQWVILDNASFHRKKAIERILKKVGCQALFLPTYSPDLNPIEHQWQPFKIKVRTLRRQNLSLNEAMKIAVL